MLVIQYLVRFNVDCSAQAIAMSQSRKYHSGAEKRKQMEQKERELRIGKHTLFELGVKRSDSQDMLENKDGDTENHLEIEELHPLISPQEEPAMLDDII